MNAINILLTAIGGDIGYSVYKILKQQDFVKTLICTDVSCNNAGAHLCEKFEILPKASDNTYLSSLRDLVDKYNIDVIIPISEAELRFFSKNNIKYISNARILMASQKATEIGFDKFATNEFLRNNEFTYPWTKRISAGEKPNSYPCIIKDPTGCGNKTTYIAETPEDYKFYSAKFPNHIVQQYIIGDEYTCGVFRDRNKKTRTIIFKRELQGGLTGHGELVRNEKINELLVSVAEKLDLQGSINVQLRMNNNGIYIFEINPRFSSTVLFRHKLNFKDLIWSIQDFYAAQSDEYKEEEKNVEFYRIFDELVIYSVRGGGKFPI